MDDVIYRQAAIDALEKEKPTPFVNKDGSIDPFGAGRQNQWYRDGIAIMNLPSAQPERKKGKWVEVAVTDGYDIEGVKTWVSVMQCDQCGFIVNAVEGHMAQYNYCPNCGADMRGEKDG